MKYFLILFSLCLTFSLKADIRDIPKRDINEINSLFERLILAYDFGYTIFGSKPMSLADMCLKIPPNLPIHKYLKARFLLSKSKRRLNAWYKYRDKFNFKDFIFLDEEEKTPNCFVFILINKKNMLNVLHEHKNAFKQELGETFTPETFLEKIEKKEVSLAQATHDSQRLLGIMLGYGERNATLFQERFDLLRECSKQKKDNLTQVNELSEKLNQVESQLGDFNDFEEEPIIAPLYFFADITHSETIELKQRYANDRAKIEELMKQPKFKGRVLKRLLE
jgi:hypothetical protein